MPSPPENSAGNAPDGARLTFPPPASSATAGPAGRVVLLAAIFAASACGLAYELTTGATAAYLLGDSITEFSLTIGVFLAAMGAGGYASAGIHRRLLERFIEAEIGVAVLGGLGPLLINAAAPWGGARPATIVLLLITGALIGLEVPLLVRVLRDMTSLREGLADVLGLDYLGALAASLLFPLVLLPGLGVSRSAAAFGLLNAAVAATLLWWFRGSLAGARRLRAAAAAAGVILTTALIFAPSMAQWAEAQLYEDTVIFTKQTPYQRLVLTRWRGDLRLFIDGHLQFSSRDEHRYHEALVHPAMMAAGRRENILILGGGDGLAAREVLKYPEARAVLVDIDPEMTALARSHPDLAAQNGGALASPRVTIVHADAAGWINTATATFDVIIADLPDPHDANLGRLYSHGFYAAVAKLLGPAGVFAVQATSPYFAIEAFTCVGETLRDAGLTALPYHVYVPSFGDWGFYLAGHGRPRWPQSPPPVPVRFLTPGALQGMIAWDGDAAWPEVEVSTTERPIIVDYHESGWRRHFE